MENIVEQREKRTAWFCRDRFGLFIHWGLYALPGGLWKDGEMDYIGEWLQARFRIPKAEYEQLASKFNPVNFNAEEWVALAKEAGMRYIVFTTKHHEGFAMFHSKCDRFNVVDATPFGRDVLAELAAACKKFGMRLGIYYSQDLDWHEPDAGDPGPNFPKNHGTMSWGNDWDFPDRKAKNFSRYLNGKVIPQLTELLTGYGPISVLWFDTPVSISREDSQRLAALVRQYQPDCLINTRLGNGLGDYGSLGDNQLPAARREGAWETPGTLNDTWGYKFNDHNWKSPAETVRLLAELAEKDTNYLLNVGPQPDGRFPADAIRILKEVGQWMDRCGEGVRGTSGNPFPYGFNWGGITVALGGEDRFTRLHLFLARQAPETLTLCGLKDRVRRCWDMADPAREFPFRVEPTAVEGVNTLRIDLRTLSRESLLPAVAVELDTREAPQVETRLIAQDGVLRLMAALGEIRLGEQAWQDDGSLVSTVGAAGERPLKKGHADLDATGAIVGWHNPADAVAWKLVFVEPGEYHVEITTRTTEHSGEHSSGQTVRLTYQGDDSEPAITWTAKLTASSVIPGIYAQGTAPAGTLKITRPASGTLVLQMLDPGPKENAGMALCELVLTQKSNP